MCLLLLVVLNSPEVVIVNIDGFVINLEVLSIELPIAPPTLVVSVNESISLFPIIDLPLANVTVDASGYYAIKVAFQNEVGRGPFTETIHIKVPEIEATSENM